MTFIYRYYLPEHLVDIFYDPNSDEIISHINVYPIVDNMVGSLKKRHLVSDMSYSLYIQTLLILNKHNLL